MSHLLLHEHLIVRAEVKNPPTCVKAMDEWMINAVDKIGMKILMGPYSIYSDMIGNRGLTSAVILSTSHFVVHTFDEVSPALFELDVYSCSTLDIEIIFDLMRQFIPTSIEYKFIDRADTIKVLSSGHKIFS